MSAKIEIRSAPHVKAPVTVETIMRHVVYSLLPICAFFIFQYGISAAVLILVTTASCLLAERLFIWMGGQSGALSDFSATITGLLLALSLPPGFPFWMAFVGGVVAIGLGKALFGGIGFNVFNPALVGRAFAQAAFPMAIATYTPSFLKTRFTEFIPSSLALPLMKPPETAAWAAAMKLDAWTGATPLAQWKYEKILISSMELLTSLGGHLPVGPAPLLILLCGAYLAARRFLDWRIPVATFGSACLLGLILFSINPGRYPDPFFILLSGGLVLGAVYMATDMATSPVTTLGMWLYGGLIGVLTVIIRFYSGLPEGVMYAILIANAVTPLLERVTQPTPFGKGIMKKPRRNAVYPLTPKYLSKEDSDAAQQGLKSSGEHHE